VIRWEHLGTATVPDGGGELRLMRRGQEFSIMAPGGIELMNSRLSGSEEALAKLAIERVGAEGHVLVGGYGMGFTLRAALATLGPKGRVTVAELVPEVIDWARGPMAELTAGGLDDPRTTVALGDVGDLIRARAGAYDAILLDVDNGPEGLSRPANDRIYNGAGLAAAKAALRPGGVLAVWSSAPSAAFTKRLRGAGFAVEELSVRASIHKRGGRHTIWMASQRS
jgi:spermidine synthase